MPGIAASLAFISKFVKEIRQLSCIDRRALAWPVVGPNITMGDSAANTTR
jgi:hypothetical protein